MTYFQSKIRRHHNFLIWVFKYCIQENYVCYNFCHLSGSKAFLFQNTNSILASFGLKMAATSHFLLFEYSLNQLKLSYPLIWYPQMAYLHWFSYLGCVSGQIDYFWHNNGPFLTQKLSFWPENGKWQKILFKSEN